MIADAQSGAGLKRLAGLPGGGAHPASFERIDLAVEGMSCAACVRTVESSLNRLDGVHASVNLATETAAVLFEPEFVDSDQLLGAVRDAGYAAQVSEHPWSRSERIDPSSLVRIGWQDRIILHLRYRHFIDADVPAHETGPIIFEVASIPIASTGW